jgi:head-tail adaptor
MPLSLPRPGEMNRRVSLMRRSSTTNAMNEQIDAYNEIGKRWAKIEVLFGSKNYETSQEVAKSTYRITLWRDKSAILNIRDRVFWTDLVTNTLHRYEIEQIPPDQNNMQLALEVYELAGGQ